MLSGKFKKGLINAFFGALYLFFLGFKLIVMLQNADFVDINARNALKIEDILRAKEEITFITVGNAMNSIGIFRDGMIPLINESNADFVVFTGNFLLDGGNDKYAALNRMLIRLNKPALFVFGDREVSDRGADNFFHHMGNPYFFFTAGGTLFVFLDTTGYTDESIQSSWIRDLLNQFDGVNRRVVFSNRSFYENDNKDQKGESRYRMSESYRTGLLELFAASGVSASISSSYGKPLIAEREGVTFIAGGGGGGIIVPDSPDTAFYYTRVTLAG
ncbi:MAG: hypothetical protein JXA95_01510, partial [Spirochaetales bacterium]|nr:hypothetical protein [Spirochaetales bacterium]